MVKMIYQVSLESKIFWSFERSPYSAVNFCLQYMSSESSQLVLNVIIQENKARNKREVRGRPSKSSEQFSCVIFKILKWIKDDDLEINANFCLLAT